MDNLTDDERRQIYEEEERKEEDRRRRRRRRPDTQWLAVIGFLVLLVVAMPIVGQAGLVDRALARNEAQVREAGKFPTAAPETLPTPAPTPATGMRTTFGDGVWLIGDQMPPGTYRAEPPSSGCYWARVAEFSDLTRLTARSAAATDSGVWSAGTTPPVEIAWIRDTDAAFETVGCGPWRRLAQ